MNVTKLEQVLTAYLAEQIGAVLDREIYRGCFIQEPEGIAVMLNHRIEEARPALYTYAAQVCVRFADRDEAWQTLHKVAEALPVYGHTADGVEIVSLIPRGEAAVYPDSEDGSVIYYGSLNLIIAAR